MKMHYSDYVTYCIKAYVNMLNPVFETDAQQKNWLACRRVLMRSFTEAEREILVEIYSAEKPTVADALYAVCEKRELRHATAWSLVSKFESQFAKERGLI